MESASLPTGRGALKQSALALDAFRTLVDEVQNQIGDSPGMQSLKAKLLETALNGLDQAATTRLHPGPGDGGSNRIEG